MVQVVVLMVRTMHVYDRFYLSVDYSTFQQAWQQIATGHLDPYLSPGCFSYWRSHFELIMWPLSTLSWLNRNDRLTLLILQDLSIVFAVAIALGWIDRGGNEGGRASGASWRDRRRHPPALRLQPVDLPVRR